jgi:sigma-B regulation protein RsbU (phosphoserine phosphatase)
MTERPAYGLLVDWLKDEYQNEVLAGVEDAAQKLSVNLRVFVGGVLRSPERSGAHRNFVYDLVSPDDVRGLVVMAGAIGNYVGPEELARFCERFRGLAMCSVGIELAGMPSVLVDNQRGMRNLLAHLIQVHGYRRLAFIRGPQVNSEAERRYEVYQQILGEYGIAFDADLVTQGDFQPASGVAAIRTLLEERRVQFDAVVAAADSMALGAMDALSARGIRVPYDVALVGFDDSEAARFASSPLTTVRQPLREQGVYAMQTVLAQSRGESIEDQVVLRTQLVVRESCGCPPQTALPLARYERTTAAEDLASTILARRQQIVEDMARAMRSLSSTLEVGWAERLLDALGAELRADPEGVFLSTLSEILTTVTALRGKVNAWQGVVSVLRHHAQACASSDPDGVARAEELWHQARVCVGNIAERAQARQRLQSERWQQVLRATEEALSAARDPTSLSAVLFAQLPRLKIPSCHVALFEGDEVPAERARLVATYCADALPEHVALADPFPPRLLGPPGLLDQPQRATHIVQPLFVESQPLGFAVLQMGPHDGMMSEHLRDQLNAALWRTRLSRRAIDDGSGREQAEQGQLAKGILALAQTRTSVLPQRFDLPGLRVSAGMIAGPEIGGDYYDVLPVDDGCLMAVGEVVGQGPQAALVMLMLQSAVAAAWMHAPNASPSELLCTVNAVLFENIRHRLGEDRPVALTLIHCGADGRLVFAGAHQPLIVCRTHDGSCTWLSTPGTKVGVVSDISRVTVDTHCQLAEADLLVLYTDGAVEATNERGERFGRDRLCHEIQKLRQQSVEDIRDRLLSLIGGFAAVQNDDATLLVARYGVSEETLALDPQSRPG